MKRWHWIFLALSPFIVAAILIVPPRLGGDTEHAQAQGGLTLALDMDVTNGSGPCDPNHIDASSPIHALGDDYGVGICIGGMTAALGNFEVHVRYDDTLNQAPNVACTGACLDGNPDANAGSNTWGTSLGAGWNCSPGGNPPQGDNDPATGPGNGEAVIACYNLNGPYTFGDNETSGTLAVVNFHVGAGGVDNLTLNNVAIYDYLFASLGSCNPTLPDSPETTCTGGTDNKTGAPPPTNTPTITPTVTNTPCPNGICPTPTNTPKPWTKTPTPAPTGTATPAEPATPAPPPPPPPSGGTLPQVVPPATGSGPDGVSWTNTALWLLVAAGAVSISLGGLYLRRARNR